MTCCGSCGRTMSDGGPLCTDETQELVRRLRAVPELLADLELTLTRQDRLGGRGAGRSSERPVPWKEQVPAVVWALGNTVTTWARELATVHSLRIPPPPPPKRPRRAIPPGARSDRAGRPAADFDAPSRALTDLRHAVTWLIDHADKLRRLFDAVQAHDEITDAIAHARRVIDRPPDLRFVGPCGADLPYQPELDPELEDGDEPREPLRCQRDLYVVPGAEDATCPDCGTEWPVEERREWLLSVVHDEDVTYAEASRALSWLVGASLPASTIRTWVSRGQLEVHRYLHRRPPPLRPIFVTERQATADQPLVRVGDVIRLVTGQPAEDRDTPAAATQS